MPGGPYALSAGTNSIAGTIGSLVVKPIAVGPTSRGCTQASGILTCTLSTRAETGAHNINLYAYGTPSGSGPKLARGIGQVTVYAGHRNHVEYLDWNGFAKSIAVVASPSSLLQGQAAAAKIAVFGVDPAGAMVALPNVRGPSGGYISNLAISATGPYVASLHGPSSSSESPGLYFPITFAYDGVLKGTEKVRAQAANGGVAVASTKLELQPGLASAAQLFVQVDVGIGPSPANVYQFVPNGSPDIAPLRLLDMPTGLVASGANGGSWGLLPIGGQIYQYSELDQYDRYGKQIARIPARFSGATPANLPYIGGATVDRAGNAYVVDELQGQVPKIDVYSAGCYSCAPTTSIAVGTTTVGPGTRMVPFVAVDGTGNIYVVENSTILEYASTGGAPLRAITLPNIVSLAADTAGNLYVLNSPTYLGVASQLTRYPTSGPPTVLLTNSSTTLLLAVATGSDGTLYLGYDYRSVGSQPYQFEINKLAPGSSTWTLVIGGPAAELPQDQITAAMSVSL